LRLIDQKNLITSTTKYLKGISQASVYERHNQNSRIDFLKNSFLGCIA